MSWKNITIITTMLALLTASNTVGANSTAIRYSGSLVAEPCAIQPGDENIQLDFGTIVDKYLYLHQRTHSQPFSLHLIDCDTQSGNSVTMTFSGTENSALPGLLAFDRGSLASGAAVGLETQQGRALPINSENPSYPLRDGSNIITLQAYVRAEPMAIENKTIGLGDFTAVATFTLNYE